MNCITYSVKEGNTGVLYLTDQNGNTKIYQPNCDLDKTQKYLYEYHDLITQKNTSIKDSFIINKVDWYSTSVSMVYWQFFFQYVKYEQLIEDWKSGNVLFESIDEGRFKKILCLLGYVKNNKKPFVSNFLRKLLSEFAIVRNRVMVRSGQEKIIFLRPSLADFRTNQILENLQQHFSVVQLIPFPKKQILNVLLNPAICILPILSNSFHHNNLPDVRFKNNTLWIYEHAIEYTKELISQHISSFNLFNKYMSKSHYKLFIGLDDCNYPYPYIFAAQDNGISCYGIQHGGYAARHEAYVMTGLKNHRWYDYLLVWGMYWKKIFLDNNKIFPSENVLVASNKHSYDYTILNKNSKKRSILIPYEFLADTISIGNFIKVFYANKFDIYFKPRSDEVIYEQTKAYNLGEVEDKLIIINDISPETMSNIDIIAGTMTTLLYDLLPFNKPIWILETSFKLQEDMIENGFARKVTMSDLGNLDKIYLSDVGSKKLIDTDYISGTKTVADLLKEMN
jgi:hypothetical protein